MKASLGPRKLKKNKWLIPFSILLLTIIIGIYGKEYFYDNSRKNIINLQDKIRDSDGKQI